MNPTAPPTRTSQPERELTARAILTGLALGAALAISNLYLGLKAGWAVGVSMTAIILATTFWRGVRSAGLCAGPLGILEANAMASVASALAFSSAAVLYAAIPALFLLGMPRPPLWELMAWLLVISLLGITLAWPLRQRIATSDALTFPSGVATAELLRGLAAQAQRVGAQARSLFWAAGASAGWTIWAQLPLTANWFRPPSSLVLPGSWLGRPWSEYGLSYALSGLPLAVGAILGPGICAWMLAGSALGFLVLAPSLYGQGYLESFGFREIMSGYSLWLGSALMISGSLTELAFDWRVFRRALREGGGATLGLGARTGFGWALLGLSLGFAGLAHLTFGVELWQAFLAVGLAALFVPVAVRAMGETDITPVGDFSKMTQLFFGGVAPGRLWTNVAAASLIAGSSAAAADLAERQRCTQRIGGRLGRQTLAYIIGSAAGALLLVPVFYLLVPDVALLGSEVFPAPAAQSLRAVAQMLGGGGMADLPPLGRSAFLVGTMLGIAFATLRRLWGRRAWLPSAMGLGMGLVLDLESTLSFFVGALLASLLRRQFVAWSGVQMLPIAGGLIAGESLAGVCLALVATFGS